MDLVVGATGMLGREMCHLLRGRGRPVRAMVRQSSDPAVVAGSARLGAEIVHGDLKDQGVARRGVPWRRHRGHDGVVHAVASGRAIRSRPSIGRDSST